MRVLGRVERFRDRLQLDVRSLEASDVDPATLTPAARRDRDELEGFLEFLVARDHPSGPRRDRCRPCSPTATSRRTPRRPTTTTRTPAACSSTPSASRRSAARRRSSIRGSGADLLLAAALVHDVGRTVELGRGPAFTPTDEGRLLGHVQLGLRLIDQRAERAHAAPSSPSCCTASPSTTMHARRPHRRSVRALPREPARRDRRRRAPSIEPARSSRSARASPGASPTSSGRCFARTLGILPRALLGADRRACSRSRSPSRVRGEAPDGWAVLFASARRSAGMLGLFAYYRGMAIGAMSVVAPIAGVSAVIPVVFGIATGDSPSAAQIAGIACALARRRARLARAPARAGGASRPASASRCSPRSGSASTSRRCTPRARSTSGGRRSSSARRALLLVAGVGRGDAARRFACRDAISLSSCAVGLGDTLGNVLLRGLVAATGSSA